MVIFIIACKIIQEILILRLERALLLHQSLEYGEMSKVEVGVIFISNLSVMSHTYCPPRGLSFTYATRW